MKFHILNFLFKKGLNFIDMIFIITIGFIIGAHGFLWGLLIIPCIFISVFGEILLEIESDKRDIDHEKEEEE